MDFVAEEAAPYRHYACQLLSAIAVGDQVYWLSERVDPVARRREVQRLADGGPELRERERLAWVQAGQDERERYLRDVQKDAECQERVFQVRQVQVKAYDAGLAGAPVFARLLESDDVSLQLCGSGLVAWLPEARDLFVSRLCALIGGAASPHVRANAAVAAGLLADNDDPVVLDALQGLRDSGNQVERWSACLGLGELMSQPDDRLVADLYECCWQATDRLPYFGFLSGWMNAFASLTIAALPASAAAARVEVVLELLGRPGRAGDDDDESLAHMLLDATIGQARTLNGLPFARLSALQRRALLAISEMPKLDDDLLRLLRSFDVPAPTAAALRRWVLASA